MGACIMPTKILSNSQIKIQTNQIDSNNSVKTSINNIINTQNSIFPLITVANNSLSTPHSNNLNQGINQNSRNNNYIRDSFSIVSTEDSSSKIQLRIEFPAETEEIILPIYLKKNQKTILKISGAWQFYEDFGLTDFKGYNNIGKVDGVNVGQLMGRIQGSKEFIIDSSVYEIIPRTDGLLVLYANGDFVTTCLKGCLTIFLGGSFQSLESFIEINKATNWKGINNHLINNQKFFFQNSNNISNMNQNNTSLNNVNNNDSENLDSINNIKFINNLLKEIDILDDIQKEEFDLFILINKVRYNPKQFAEQFIDIYKYKQLYNFLINYTSVGMVEYNEALTFAAKEHCYDIGKNGLNGHISSNNNNFISKRIGKFNHNFLSTNAYFGECLQFGKRKAYSILISLLNNNIIKFPVYRYNLLNEKYDKIGISINCHKIYRWGCVIMLAN